MKLNCELRLGSTRSRSDLWVASFDGVEGRATHTLASVVHFQHRHSVQFTPSLSFLQTWFFHCWAVASDSVQVCSRKIHLNLVYPLLHFESIPHSISIDHSYFLHFWNFPIFFKFFLKIMTRSYVGLWRTVVHCDYWWNRLFILWQNKNLFWVISKLRFLNYPF